MSARNKFKFGKIVKNYQGYDIRLMVKTQSIEGKKGSTTACPTGKFGIYAGKKILEETSSLDKAMEVIVQKYLKKGE